MEFKFFGEFGYLHQLLLAPLERFVNANQDKYNKITIYTYKGNDLIIDNLFPNFFLFICEDLTLMENNKQIGRRAGLGDDIYTNKYIHVPDIMTMFNESIPNWLGSVSYGKLHYISRPLIVKTSQFQSIISGYNRTYLYFFRNRNHEPFRNFSNNQSLETYFNDKIESQKDLHVIYYFNCECLVPNYFKDRSNVMLCNNMNDIIYLFNNCDEFITNNSGLEDFAKNCKCKAISVIPDENNSVTRATIEFNPFNTEVKLINISNPHLPNTDFKILC